MHICEQKKIHAQGEDCYSTENGKSFPFQKGHPKITGTNRSYEKNFNFNKARVLNRAVKKPHVNSVETDSANEGQISTINSPLIYAAAV